MEDLKNAFKTLGYLFLCLLFFIYIFIAYIIIYYGYYYNDPGWIARESFDPICTSVKMKAAMKYHGIIFTEYDQDRREWGFRRDGQWCSLYRSIPEKKLSKLIKTFQKDDEV